MKKKIEFLTFVFVVGSAILNYVFVTQLSTKLENYERQTKIALDLTTMIKDMQPNVKIDAAGITWISKDSLNMGFRIKNLGEQVVIIDEPPLYLATEPITSTDKIKNQLELNKDFELVNMRIGDVPPVQEVNQSFTIKFKNPEKLPVDIYYYTAFPTKTDWAFAKLVEKLLVKNLSADYLTNEEIQKLISRTYTRWGVMKLEPKPRVIENKVKEEPNRGGI